MSDHESDTGQRLIPRTFYSQDADGQFIAELRAHDEVMRQEFEEYRTATESQIQTLQTSVERLAQALERTTLQPQTQSISTAEISANSAAISPSLSHSSDEDVTIDSLHISVQNSLEDSENAQRDTRNSHHASISSPHSHVVNVISQDHHSASSNSLNASNLSASLAHGRYSSANPAGLISEDSGRLSGQRMSIFHGKNGENVES
jgi:hypothetical protein